jgi:hypothetical protein
MPAPTSSSPYKPVEPLSAEWSCVLSQDVITTATIPVDSTSRAPVAVFTNPSSGGIGGNARAEALAIVNTGNGKQICHVARDRATDGGWRAIPLFGGRSAQQVAAAVPYAGTSQAAVHGLFLDGLQLHVTSLAADGVTWSAPVTVTGTPLSNPRIAYSPAGRAVVYGVSPSGDLATAYQTQVGGPFTSVVCAMKGVLTQDDFQLCMIDEQSFTILANYNSQAYLITGVLGADHYSSLGAAPEFKEKLLQVALGYWSPAQNTLIFLLVDDDKALHAWAQNSASSNPVVQKIPNGSLSQATGHIDYDGSLHVYAIDHKLGLWVLHQSARQPWREDGTPNWAPMLPLDKGVTRVVSDMNPAAAPSLFALDGADFSLRLHAQDAKSRLWKSDKVMQHATQAYEVARYRTEVRIVDGNGRSLPRQAVTVAVEKGCSTVEAWAGGLIHHIDENGATLITDATGKLTISLLANDKGLACPNLVVSGGGLASQVTVKPAGAVHSYLSGKGTLNPTNPGGALPVFDASGSTLKRLTPDATPTAAEAIRNGAMVALKDPPPGVLGFGGSLRKGNHTFEVFHTETALQAHRSDAGLVEAGGFWEELAHFFGDIFEGICNAVIAIAHFVVDVVRAVVDFTLQIAEWTAKALGLPVDGIEKAASFMNGVFNSVDAGIDKVVDWLKALFDFGAIWRTKMAIEEGITAVPSYVKQLALLSQKRADNWFAQQKQTVDDAFAAFKKEYANQTFGAQQNWQNPAAPASSQPIAGGAALSDFTNNPHHNWLWDKLASNSPNAPAMLFGARSMSSADDPWDAFAKHLGESGKEFLAAIGKFKDAIWSIITNPASFATTAIPDFIDMANLLVDALLDLCDAIVDAAAGLAVAAMEALETALTAELQLGFLNTLWSWIAGAAGYPQDGKLTFGALASLVVAFPSTLIYKLIQGVDQEPFPDGKFPVKPHAPDAPYAAQIGVKMPWVCILLSDIARIVQVIPAGFADIDGNNAPWWLTGIGVVWSMAVWALRNGYPAFSPEGWVSFTAAAVQLMWIGPTVYFALKSAAWVKEDPKALGDAIDLAITASGALMLVAGIGLDIFAKLPPGQKIANILTPMPSLFCFLNMTVFRDNVDAPFAIAANLLADTVGFVGGGVELMIDTIHSKPRVAVA